MAEKKKPEIVNEKSTRTLTDDQIVSERSVSRRSFLTAAGTLVAGGAAALALGNRALAQDPDAKKTKDTDPDSKKETKDTDPDSKKETKNIKKATDPDSNKGQKQNKGKETDPDSKKKKTKDTDPDKKPE